MKGKNINGIQTKPDLISSTSAGISVVHCDILYSEELSKLSQTVHDTCNGIDIVIDNTTNGIFDTVHKDDCKAFVDGTSGRLRTTINVSRTI